MERGFIFENAIPLRILSFPFEIPLQNTLVLFEVERRFNLLFSSHLNYTLF